MAADWIKMRVDLLTSPKVVRISSALNVDRLKAVGALFSAWCLFDVHSEDGKLPGYTPEVLDSIVGLPGLSNAMQSVGWLDYDGATLSMPRFNTHNGRSAKRRAEDAERKRDVRKTSATDADKMRTREEKRREEKKEETPPTPPLGGGTDASKPIDAPPPKSKPRKDPPRPDPTPGPHAPPADDDPDPKPWEPDPENPWAVTFDEFLEAWTEAKLPGAGKLQESSMRRAWLQDRLKDDYWRANWLEAIRRAGQSSRCRGETQGWSGLTITMFLKTHDWVVRILEGEFDDKRIVQVKSEEERYEEFRRLQLAAAANGDES